jgi:hypothetical protein
VVLELVPDSIDTRMAMTSPRQPSAGFWLTVALVAVLVPTCAYVTAYFCMVTPRKPGGAGGIGPWPKWADYTGPNGDRDQDFWENVFAPVHWVDTRLRPDVWFF